MQQNNNPFLHFNDLPQSGNRVGILVNCGIHIPFILFYSRISFLFDEDQNLKKGEIFNLNVTLIFYDFYNVNIHRKLCLGAEGR